MLNRTLFLALVLSAVPLLIITSMACSDGDNDKPTEPLDDAVLLQNVESDINVISTEFHDGEEMPGVHTCYGLDRSPPLSWSNVPDNTKSLTLIDEPDSPEGSHRVSCIVYNLPSDVTELPPSISTTQESANGGTQGRNHTGRRGWTGPCPKEGGKNEGFYTFNLYALDTVLDLEFAEGTQRNDLIQAMTNHVIGHGLLMSRFCRSDGSGSAVSAGSNRSATRGSCPPR